MLRTETVTAGTLDILRDLMQDALLHDFFLVGGTALSLQIGHRISIDIDLFSQTAFDVNKISLHLETEKNFQVSFIDKNTLKGQIKNTQVDLITHAYPLVKNISVPDSIRLASLEDIAAMKLNSIVVSGSRLKDFIDLAFLSAHLSLAQMTDAYEQKYDTRNPVITLKALTYFADLNFEEPIHLIAATYNWDLVAARLHDMVKWPEKIFPTPPF